MRRAVWAVLLGVLLSACGVYEVKDAAIGSVDVEVLSNATVRVVAHGTLGDGCTRVGEVTQRREAQTFFVGVKEVYDQPFGKACTLAVGEFQQEVLLDVQGLERGSYTVDVNGVTESFELDGEGVFVKGGWLCVGIKYGRASFTFRLRRTGRGFYRGRVRRPLRRTAGRGANTPREPVSARA